VTAAVDYLIHVDPLRFSELGRKLRQRTDVRDALREVYDLSILDLGARLEAWVRETYSLTD
jgi:hypothetical protein